MFYLDVYQEDDTVEIFCSKDINLLFLAVKDSKEIWLIGNSPREALAEEYEEFEITAECQPIEGKLN